MCTVVSFKKEKQMPESVLWCLALSSLEYTCNDSLTMGETFLWEADLSWFEELRTEEINNLAPFSF